MACPQTFFDFNLAYFRLDEVISIEMKSEGVKRILVVTLRGGKWFSHLDYNGSAQKIERRLLDAIAAQEG
jgi:hypothetical protein